MESLAHIPPGYRFHPTDEELVDYYLKNKVAFPGMQVDVIKDVDLYKIEPWDIQGMYALPTFIMISSVISYTTNTNKNSNSSHSKSLLKMLPFGNI